jgi:hypothetical protein
MRRPRLRGIETSRSHWPFTISATRPGERETMGPARQCITVTHPSAAGGPTDEKTRRSCSRCAPEALSSSSAPRRVTRSSRSRALSAETVLKVTCHLAPARVERTAVGRGVGARVRAGRRIRNDSDARDGLAAPRSAVFADAALPTACVGRWRRVPALRADGGAGTAGLGQLGGTGSRNTFLQSV